MLQNPLRPSRQAQAIPVVDDEKPIREGCERLLSDKGYRVATAEDGRKALEVIEKTTMDIILLDLKMPRS